MFIIAVGFILLLLSLASNYVYVWLFKVRRIHAVTLLISFGYVAITIVVSVLSRSAPGIAHIAANASGLMLGIGYYLFFCSIVGIILYAILSLFRCAPPSKIYGFIVITLAITLSTAGFIYAETITVKNHSVILSTNPTKSKTFALISDTHFGPARNTKLATRLTDKLSELSPEAILYAGDMYDGPAFDFATINPALEKLSKIAPVYFNPGNHEAYGPYNEFMENNTNMGFINLVDEIVTDSGITIIGIDYRLPNQSAELESFLQNLETRSPELFDQPVIAIHHSPIMHDILSRNGIDLSVHGHSHRGQFWPNGLITRMIYGKYHYGLHNYNDLSVITTSGVGTAGTAMRLFNTPEIVLITVEY